MEIQEHIAPPIGEKANVLTHGTGLILSFFAMLYLLKLGFENRVSQLELLSLIIFSCSLVLVYFSSTMYHYSQQPVLRFRLQILDHISIYFLIAGTHTPFLIFHLNNTTGRLFLLIMWGMAFIGILYKLLLFGRFQLLSVFFYLLMGWMAIFTMPLMFDRLAAGVLSWVLFGGISYTVGVIFFLWKKLPYHHAIWHMLVMAGSAAHFTAIWFMVRG